jgi:hypothetical protein
MSCLQMIVGLSLCRSGSLDLLDQSLLDQIPDNIRAAAKKFKLEGKTIVFAVCPKCNKTYPPEYKVGSTVAKYPAACSGQLSSDAACCEEVLLKPTVQSDGTIKILPLKVFAYHSFKDFVACLLSRSDLELAAEQSLDAVVDQATGIPRPSMRRMKNIFDAKFIRTFKGPDGTDLFAYRKGETRLLFSLFVDFFNVNTVLHRGANTSNGIIAMACLNLPMEQRHLPENIYIAGIIPGPDEPRLTEINHFIEPLINELVEFWNPGIQFTRTALHKNQIIRCAIACVVCDLPAARKVSGLAAPTAHHFCSVCSCAGKPGLARTDVGSKDWEPRNLRTTRDWATSWRYGTLSEQKDIFQAHGLRYSVLWKLCYWNPAQQLIVDPMHCLLENLAHHHFRDYLQLTSAASAAPNEPRLAFIQQFSPYHPRPSSRPIVERVTNSPKLEQEIQTIRRMLSTPSSDVNTLFNTLRRYSVSALLEVCNRLGTPIRFKTTRKRGKPQKEDYAWSLAYSVSNQRHSGEETLTIILVGPNTSC